MSKTDSDKENVDSAKMAEQTTKANRNDLPGSSSGPQNLALNTHKAGMEGLDTEKINEIIKKASEGSRFYQHKQKCQQRLDAKIVEMKRAAEAFSEEQIKKATLQMDHLVKELESRRDLTHTIVHVDMDMFYAAVEMRDDPSLRDKPMAVGSTGMLSTSNYAARKFGVRAAMPGFIGKKLCPDLVIVRPDFTKYKQASKEIQEIFSQYDPNFCPMSLDEAYLDITEYLVKNAHVLEMEDEDCETPAERVVNEMRRKIQEKTKLTASAGIASNTRLAKVCSDMNKPNGQYYLPPEHQRILDFISSLPIRKVSGIGNVMEQQLSAIGVNICSDLMKKRGLLKLLFSDINYNNFLSIALGLGHTTLSTWTEKDRKSISTETTFRGTADRNVLFTITKDLCHELADEMAQKDIFGKVFTLKYKTVDFQIRSRAQTFPDAVQTSEVMATTARRILQHEMDVSPQPLALRLIGVRMSNLLSSSEVGPNRQSTLTQLFSNNNDSCATKHCSDDKKSTHLQKNNGESQLSAQISMSENANKKSMANQGLKNASIGHYLSKAQNVKSQVKKFSYECPVCGDSVEVPSLVEFNKHVDICLAQGASVSVQSLEDSKTLRHEHKEVSKSDTRDTDEPSNNENLKHTESSKETLLYTQGSSDSAQSNHCSSRGIYTFSDYESDEELDFLEDNDNLSSDFGIPCDRQEDEEKNSGNAECKLKCPICEEQHFENITALNEHVDECLSKSTINEILQQSTSQTSQLKPSNNQPSKSNCKRKGSSINKQAKKIKPVNNTIERFFSS